jgi:hypothetical protein
VSTSFEVIPAIPKDIAVAALNAQINRAANELLRQRGALRFETVFAGGPPLPDNASGHEMLVPDGTVRSFMERTYGLGAYVIYGREEYCEYCGPRKLSEAEMAEHRGAHGFSFAIVEIPRQRDDLMLTLCVSMVIAVSRLLAPVVIRDGGGTLVTGRDEITAEELLAAAAEENLPVTQAMKSFYDRLPIRSSK